jgi:small-conductance mechanosensitive channel
MSINPFNYDQSGLKKPILLFALKLLSYSIMIYFGFAEDFFNIKTSLAQGVLYASTFFLGLNLMLSFARIVVISWYLRKHRHRSLNRNNFVLGINRISSILNTCIFVVAIMILFDIDIRHMFVSLSIVAAALAVLSKDYITNMCNGLIIMFSDRLSLGDKITVNGFSGRILDITLVNIIIENEDADVVVVPNSVVFSSIVLNKSKKHIRRITIEFELSLIHQLSLDMLEETIKMSLEPFSDHIDGNSFLLKILDIKKDLVYCKAQLVVPRRDKEIEDGIRRAMLDSVLSFSGSQFYTTEGIKSRSSREAKRKRLNSRRQPE